jgi:cytoskeletal protein RodZ
MPPTTGTAPVSYPQPPTYDPTAAQMFSAPPVSVYPYAYPYGPPVAVAPMPAKRSNVFMVVSISLVCVFALATAIMTTLFFVQKHQTGKANDTINNMSAQANTLNSNNQDLQKQLTQAQSDKDQSDQAKEALAACLNAIEAAGRAGQLNNTVPQSLIDDLNTKCDAAQKYL